MKYVVDGAGVREVGEWHTPFLAAEALAEELVSSGYAKSPVTVKVWCETRKVTYTYEVLVTPQTGYDCESLLVGERAE